jgi:hypothetical protein
MQQERDNAAIWMLAWYAAAMVAVAGWILTLSNTTPECDSICLSPRFVGVAAVALLGVPTAALALIISSVLLARLTRSSWGGSVGRGTVAALTGLFLGPSIVVCGIGAYVIVTH